MKNNFIKYLFLVALAQPIVLFCQNTDVPFSVTNAGFEISPSSGTTVISAVGQTVVEDAQQLNTHIESGFLVYSRILQAVIELTSASDSVAMEGQQFDVKLPISANLVTFAESLYYRRGGDYVYVGDTLHRDIDTLRGKIPATFATIRGIEYYIILRVAGSTVLIVTYPIANPVDVPATIPVAIDDMTYPLALQRIKYKMVSIPLDLDPAREDILSVLGGAYGGTYAPNRWRVFRWQNDDYTEYPNISSRFAPGTAFWLITQSGISFTTGTGWSVFTPRGVGGYPIVLHPGWNQIADPFAYPVSWTSILQNSQVPDSLVSRPNYYNGVEYEVTDFLKPWEGYFVYNTLNQPITLFVIPKESTTDILPLTSSSDRHLSEILYALNLTAKIPDINLQDSYNLLGFWKETIPLQKRINDLEPPAIGEYVRLSLVDKGRDFMSKLTELPSDGQTWDIELFSSIPNRLVQVSLSELGQIPSGFQRYVLDKDNFNVIPLTEGQFIIQLGEAFHKRSLRVIVGTKEFAEQHSSGIPLVPLSYALEQNYPNPFNPTTNIRYQLSKRSNIHLEIFDLLGKRVKTLVNATQLTGVYTIEWDATNDAGASVASGMYLYRLRAENVSPEDGAEYVASRKLLIVR